MKTLRLRAHGGFTLLELMAAVAIIGILAAIAIPSYNQSVLRSHRVEARTALTDLAGREEKYYSVYNQYTTDPIALGYAAVGSGAAFPLNVGSGYYEIDLPPANVTNVAGQPSTYILTAVPSTTTTQGTQQAKDTQCTSFTINQLGVQNSAPSASIACWGQ